MESLAELVGNAPLILVGEVGPVHRYLDFAVYGEDGQLLERGVGPDGVLLPEAPATDFILIVEEAIRDDGAVAGGEPIILRMPGHATEELKELTRQTDYPFVFTGDRQLFLLAPNPDGKSYTFYHGPWNQLLIDGEILRVAGGQQQPLQFADDPDPVTLEEFIQFVESQ